MASNFPTSLDVASGVGSGTGPVPATTDTTESPSHAALHQKTGDAVVAVESKVGTGASTPTANTVLGGTGSGTSAWGTVSNAQIASGVDAAKLTTGTLPTARLADVRFEGTLSATVFASASTLTAVPWTTETTDTDGFHTSGSTITIPAGLGGRYMATFRPAFTALGPAASAYAQINIDGALYESVWNTLTGRCCVSVVADIAAAATVTCNVYTTVSGGGTLATSTSVTLVQIR